MYKIDRYELGNISKKMIEFRLNQLEEAVNNRETSRRKMVILGEEWEMAMDFAKKMGIQDNELRRYTLKAKQLDKIDRRKTERMRVADIYISEIEGSDSEELIKKILKRYQNFREINKDFISLKVYDMFIAEM
ncbi:MAG: hypothetical protein KKF67_03020, partial [Nanoarchaeota archaeon]|nr:hypothetical protein [Nanoarchaeota archaeon]